MSGMMYAAKDTHKESLSNMRRLIARRMLESLRTSAQVTTVFEVDLTTIGLLRERVKGEFEQRTGVRLTYLPFIARAAVEALKQHPRLNASLDLEKGEVVYHDHQHLAVAVDTDRGLMVPVVHFADDLTIAELAHHIAALAERCRAREIWPDDLNGGTFTLTNTGSRGALFDTPIINQPQVAILGFGAVARRPAVLAYPDGRESVDIRSTCLIALSYDHRLVDGADASRFLTTVQELLQDGRVAAELEGTSW
jgi:2-oxoglutarate dehydrogenase E2 component (dihydrolipoamide succinyltransferase)